MSLSVAGVLVGSAAFAESMASSWTDLNLRAGPGPMYPILAVIPADKLVTVDGCLDASSWCKVALDGTEGWAAGNYLTTRVALKSSAEPMIIKTVTYDNNKDAETLGGAAAGAVAGALIAGPVGAVIGGMIGAGAGNAAAVDETVVTYVRANPVEQVYLDGEVVVGAGLPENVTLVPVPDSEFSYVYLNGVPVVVNSEERKVVYIVR
ncbi:DUF1236 domain-containing protein [Antarcticimicrobium luteum]|nr:DUF1236 domain-containing protein [Antarcticimicrobium luteum]